VRGNMSVRFVQMHEMSCALHPFWKNRMAHSQYQTLNFQIIAASPLLQHNGQLADPLNHHSKAIAQVTAKLKKTESDHRRLADLEFMGSLYLSGGRPCIPAEMMEAALVKAASQERRGSKAKAGLVIRKDLRLLYDGPTDPVQLCSDPNFRLRCSVRIGTARIMRTRPQFNTWKAELTIDYLPTILNPQDIRRFATVAGEQIGIGDWRPRFGRFNVRDPAASINPPTPERRTTLVSSLLRSSQKRVGRSGP
jgi:hypothetical protein